MNRKASKLTIFLPLVVELKLATETTEKE